MRISCGFHSWFVQKELIPKSTTFPFPSSTMFPFLFMSKTPQAVLRIQGIQDVGEPWALCWITKPWELWSYKMRAKMGFSTFPTPISNLFHQLMGLSPKYCWNFWKWWCFAHIPLFVGAEPGLRKNFSWQKKSLFDHFYPKKRRKICFFWDYPAPAENQAQQDTGPQCSQCQAPTGSWALLLWVLPTLSKVN